MIGLKKIFLLLVLTGLTLSCEDVIEVELPTTEQRLNINALIRVDISQAFIPIEVKVSLTNNFFEEIPITQVESIVIIAQEFDENGVVINSRTSSLSEEEPNTGIYIPDPNFSSDQRIPTNILNKDWLFSLIIRHEGRSYLAQTRYVPTVPIDTILQGNGTLFEGDETEIIVTFTDNFERDDFYVFDFNFNEFLVTEDEFFPGQQFQFSYFYDRTFESGREIDISILGADETFYNYMDQLIVQSGDSQGPFQTPTATVRGNIFDVT
ncbi:MAG: DUF4249 family protein, partial [Maribacter sp.]|nr:DUF4249 family protein [Maribacter sp.]